MSDSFDSEKQNLHLTMKNYLLLFLFAFSIAETSAQNFSYEILGSGTTAQHQNGRSVNEIPTGFSATLLANDQGSGVFHVNHYVMDTTGELLNLFKYKGAVDSLTIIPGFTETLPDSTQLISGTWYYNDDAAFSKPFVMQIASDGSVNWAKSFDHFSADSPFIKVLGDESILCVFEHTILGEATYKIYCKVDFNGNFSNFMQYPLGFDHIRKLVPNNDGTFEIVTAEGNLININNDLSSINWTRKYFVEGGIVFNRTQNGDYIFASLQTIFGHSTLFRTDAAGNVLWAKKVETFEGIAMNPFQVIHFDFIEEDNEGNITAAAYQVNSFRTMHITLDADGNFVSNFSVTTNNNSSISIDNDQMLQLSVDEFPGFNLQLELRNLGENTPCDNEVFHNILEGDAMELPPVDLSLTAVDPFETENLDILVFDATQSVNQLVFCDLFTSVEDNFFEDVEVYPNPTSGILNVEADHSVDLLHLTNQLGQSILSTTQSTLDLTDLPSGLYLLEIVTNDRSFVKRIVKQ